MVGLGLIAGFLVVQTRPDQSGAQPINLNRPVLNVQDFGADNTGAKSSYTAIRSALQTCSTVAGCEIHFPAGVYDVTPTTAPTPLILSRIPITISGAGARNTTLQAMNAATDLIYAASTSNLTIHDIGFDTTSTSASPSPEAAIHIVQGTKVSLYNLFFTNPYTAIELGQTNGTGSQVDYVTISSITEQNVAGCALRIDGGAGDVFVRGVYAQGAANEPSQVLCFPSEDWDASKPTPNPASGAQVFYMSDSAFDGFGKGIIVPGYALYFHDSNFDDIAVNGTYGGPAFELFLPPVPEPTNAMGIADNVSNIRISDSTLSSAATACVAHGSLTRIKFINDTCIGNQGAAAPSPCPTGASGSSAQRGYAIVEVGGTLVNGSSVTVNISATGFSTVTATTTVTGGGLTPVDLAHLLGIALNQQLAGITGCPVILPLQAYQGFMNSGTPPPSIVLANTNIGNDIELYSTSWSSTNPITITATATNGATVSLPMSSPMASGTFAPADSIYVGAPNGISVATPPSNITVIGVTAYGATNGAGLHLQGGSAQRFLNNRFGSRANPNLYGIQIDDSSAVYNATQIQRNDVTNNNPSASPIFLNPGPTPSPGLLLSENVGFNPVGYETSATPAPVCSSPILNPYPISQQVYVNGPFVSISKQGITGSLTLIYGSPSGMTAFGTTAIVPLGIGESVQINCSSMSPPPLMWYGQ